VKDQLYGTDYVREEDPKIYVSQKTGRGPLSDTWLDDHWNECKACTKLQLCTPCPLMLLLNSEYLIDHKSQYEFTSHVIYAATCTPDDSQLG
jgi:hypothetical protein